MGPDFDRGAFLAAYFGYLATEDDSLFWAIEVFYSDWDRCDEKFELVLALLDAAPDERSRTYVACGPLEDLLQNCGDAVIDRIEHAAQDDPRIGQALVHVWGLERYPPIESRVNRLLASQGLPRLVRRRAAMIRGDRLSGPMQTTIRRFPRDGVGVHRVALVMADGYVHDPVFVVWGDDDGILRRAHPDALDMTDRSPFHVGDVTDVRDRSRLDID
jgi:hypothetical protein